jgi:signal transduction histidine kinase
VQHSLEAFGVGEGEAATVRLRYRDDGLELEVSGATAREQLEEAALDAARERVSAHGGAFTATAQGGGLTLVRAELPLAVPSGG